MWPSKSRATPSSARSSARRAFARADPGRSGRASRRPARPGRRRRRPGDAGPPVSDRRRARAGAGARRCSAGRASAGHSSSRTTSTPNTGTIERPSAPCRVSPPIGSCTPGAASKTLAPGAPSRLARAPSRARERRSRRRSARRSRLSDDRAAAPMPISSTGESSIGTCGGRACVYRRRRDALVAALGLTSRPSGSAAWPRACTS